MTQAAQKCPGVSSTRYRAGEGLEEFPDEPHLDECDGIDISDNKLTTLHNAHCVRCDFLDGSKNKLTQLPAELVERFPNLTHARMNFNEFTDIAPEVFVKVHQLDLEHNRVPLGNNIPWDLTNSSLKLSLEGTTIVCGCSMMRAIEEQRVDILSPPICEGNPDIHYKKVLANLLCSLTTPHPRTGMSS